MTHDFNPPQMNNPSEPSFPVKVLIVILTLALALPLTAIVVGTLVYFAVVIW